MNCTEDSTIGSSEKLKFFFSSMQDIASQEIQKFLLLPVFKGNNRNALWNFIIINVVEFYYKQLGSRSSETAVY